MTSLLRITLFSRLSNLFKKDEPECNFVLNELREKANEYISSNNESVRNVVSYFSRVNNNNNNKEEKEKLLNTISQCRHKDCIKFLEELCELLTPYQ